MAGKSDEPHTEAVEVVPDIDSPDASVKTDDKISAWASCKQSPYAVLYCCYMLFTCIMWGYDGLAGAIVLSIPQWRQDYGYLYQGQYVVSANWQLGFTSASLVGLIFGGAITAVVAKRLGQKVCIAAAYVLTVGGVFCQWFSPGNMPLFFAGKLLTGLPLGIFLTIAPTYCSDVAPQALRGPMVAAVNFSIVFGQLLAYGVVRETQAKTGQEAYLIVYAVQWGFAAVGIVFLPFIPESPFQLLGRGKADAAKSSIRKMYGDQHVETRTQEIVAILQRDESATSEAGSFKDCFNRQNRFRTLIVLSVFFFQANSGVAWVVGYMGYFMQLSGMQGAEVFDATVGVAGVMAVGNIASWYLIERLGRRKLIFYGLLCCTVSLLLIGVLSLFVNHGKAVVLTQVAFMAFWAFAYQASIGAAGYAIMAEVPTSSLRGVTQSMATVVNGAANAVWSLSLAYMVNPDEANMGGRIAFVFFGLLLFADVFVFFCYPETKGRSFEEIDELFARKINPRHFAKTRLE